MLIVTTTELSTADVLRRAKAVLIERGWTVGDNEDGDGCVCAEGALIVALGGNVEDLFYPGDAYYTLRRAINGDDRSTTPVFAFNDAQDSVGPVLAAFDRAIALAESEVSR